jgi:hypothetical protein
MPRRKTGRSAAGTLANASNVKHDVRDDRQLQSVVTDLTGLTIANQAVCAGHTAPWTYFSEIYHTRPSLALVLGPRGGGKSFLSALDTHLRSRASPGYATRVLGGSRAQSAQVVYALRELVGGDFEKHGVAKLRRDGASYRNGAEVEILAASSTSVRGPHVPGLKLDEVDEIDPDLREAALGMCMNRKGEPATVLMTSTWHRVGGPMSALLERGEAGEFPVHRFCAFEILETCPEERSGPNLERCGECPLMPWCHADRDAHPSGLPKAKRSAGHYAIESLVQKVRATSRRTFEADYLCLGPRAEGRWFPGFDPLACTSVRAEYDPALPVHLALDPGVFSGAVFFQVRRGMQAGDEQVRVFADYLSEGVPAEQVARAVVELAGRHCGGRIDAAWLDPSGGSRTAIGPTIFAELERGGLRGLRPWPRAAVADGLALVESFVQPADGQARLLIHPRCATLSNALTHYRRARRGSQWQDYPEDPQHPHEDLVDALRGGLKALFPEGRRAAPALTRIPARQVF